MMMTREGSKVVRCSGRCQTVVSSCSAAARRTDGCHRGSRPVAGKTSDYVASRFEDKRDPFPKNAALRHHEPGGNGSSGLMRLWNHTHFSFCCKCLQEVLQVTLHVVVP